MAVPLSRQPLLQLSPFNDAHLALLLPHLFLVVIPLTLSVLDVEKILFWEDRNVVVWAPVSVRLG
jgi:hypothetical protein